MSLHRDLHTEMCDSAQAVTPIPDCGLSLILRLLKKMRKFKTKRQVSRFHPEALCLVCSCVFLCEDAIGTWILWETINLNEIMGVVPS